MLRNAVSILTLPLNGLRAARGGDNAARGGTGRSEFFRGMASVTPVTTTVPPVTVPWLKFMLCVSKPMDLRIALKQC